MAHDKTQTPDVFAEDYYPCDPDFVEATLAWEDERYEAVLRVSDEDLDRYEAEFKFRWSNQKKEG